VERPPSGTWLRDSRMDRHFLAFQEGTLIIKFQEVRPHFFKKSGWPELHRKGIRSCKFSSFVREAMYTVRGLAVWGASSMAPYLAIAKERPQLRESEAPILRCMWSQVSSDWHLWCRVLRLQELTCHICSTSRFGLISETHTMGFVAMATLLELPRGQCGTWVFFQSTFGINCRPALRLLRGSPALSLPRLTPRLV